MSQDDSVAARDVVASYAQLADDGEVTAMTALFAADGIWQAGETVLRGRDQIQAGIEAMRAGGHAGPGSGTRHVLGAPVVSFPAPGVAHVSCYWLLMTVAGAPAVAHMGKFEVDLRKEDDDWRVTAHTVLPLA